jgi:hypothetical protein
VVGRQHDFEPDGNFFEFQRTIGGEMCQNYRGGLARSSVFDNLVAKLSGASSTGTGSINRPGPRGGCALICVMQARRGAMSQNVTDFAMEK